MVLTATRTAGAGTVCKAVGYKPAGSWNTTTTLPLLGTNCTLSTGPPLFLRLSKCSRMASWVVLYERPLTRMLLLAGTCWMETSAESNGLFSPSVLILWKSTKYNNKLICRNWHRLYARKLSKFTVKLLRLLKVNITGKNDGFPILDILGYLKNTHKNPKFGKVRQIPISEFPTKFPKWDLSHSPKFGIFVGIL